MSVTYTDQIRPAADRLDSEAYVPVYARRSGRMSKKPVKTWMILAPLGVLVIGGAAAAMLMQTGEEATPAAIEAATPAPPAPLVAPEVSPEVSSLTAAPIAPAELTTATPAAPSVAAPVERRAPPAPTAPARTPRAAPVEEAEAPIVSTG
ncbi:hypothetical protein ACQKHM_15575, partial [Brevundimonas sp. NPDC049575]